MPLWAKGATQAEEVRGAIYLALRQHGFRIAPTAASLADAAKQTKALADEDKQQSRGPEQTGHSRQGSEKPSARIGLSTVKSKTCAWT